MPIITRDSISTYFTMKEDTSVYVYCTLDQIFIAMGPMILRNIINYRIYSIHGMFGKKIIYDESANKQYKVDIPVLKRLVMYEFCACLNSTSNWNSTIRRASTQKNKVDSETPAYNPALFPNSASTQSREPSAALLLPAAPSVTFPAARAASERNMYDHYWLHTLLKLPKC